MPAARLLSIGPAPRGVRRRLFHDTTEVAMLRWTAVPIILLAAACAGDSALDPSLDGPAPGLLEYGCPADFTLNIAGKSENDRNGDGYICYMKWETGSGTQYVEIDNNVPASQIGSCPGQFEAWVTRGHPDDRNGNGIVCALKNPSGNQTIIDDNHNATGGK